MATIRIDALPEAVVADLGMEFPVMIGGETFKLSVEQVMELIGIVGTFTLDDIAIGAYKDIASAGTLNLTTDRAFRYRVTGATPITAITLGADRWALLRFSAALTLTHDATTLILPGGANITTANGDMALIETDATGNVRVIGYFKADGRAVIGSSSNLVDQAINAQQNIAAAQPLDLAAASATAFRFNVTGTAVVTDIVLGGNKWALLYFAAAGLTLTHNVSKIILPTGGNIVTEVGDTALVSTDTAGNVTRVHFYQRASGAPLAYGQVEEWIDASEMVPAIVNGATGQIRVLATGPVPFFALAFDTATQEFAWFRWVPRKRYDGGTIRFIPYWTGDGGSAAQTVKFDLAGRFVRDDDALDGSVGTAQGSTDAFTVANRLHIGPISAAITLAGTFLAGACLAWLRIARDVAGDNYTADAELIGVKIVYTENKGNDA